MRRLRRRTIAIQLVSLIIAVIVGCSLLFAKLDAEAAPPAATATANVAPSPDETAAGDAGNDADAQAIDLAIAPDGGVPFHPSGTTYRSPFAKPNAGPPVRLKVGF